MRVHYRLMRPVRLRADLSIEGFTVLLGNTGVGKTSLLKALAGLLPAEGEPYNGLPPYRRPVGYLPQDYGLFPHLSALANVAFPLRGSQRLTEALRLLTRVGLADRAASLPRNLSGGQQQRVAVPWPVDPSSSSLTSPQVLLIRRRAMRSSVNLSLWYVSWAYRRWWRPTTRPLHRLPTGWRF